MERKIKKKRKQQIELPLNRIICDHNVRAMRKFSDNSIDSILTDPPYGLNFMGKEWDSFGVEIPGGIAYSKTGVDFKAKATGKAHSHGLAGHNPYEFQKWCTKWAKECLRVAKPGAFMLVFGGTRTFHRLTCAIEDAGWQIRDCLMWLYGSGFPKSLDISKAIDKAKGKKRKIVGKYQYPDGSKERKVGQSKSQMTPKRLYGSFDMTIPTSKLAKLWEGYGTALKPAWEPIIVAMKPVEGNFAKNAEKHGVAGLNIDGGRIGTSAKSFQDNRKDKIQQNAYGKHGVSDYDCSQGRWPANVILDEDAAKMLDKQSGNVGGGKSANMRSRSNHRSKYGKYTGVSEMISFGDSGGASRFFYIAKASRSERNAGLSGMPEKRPDTRSDTDKGIWVEKETAKQMNFHPTVKPLQLMKYLCMLLKMPNKEQIILDPFIGSGTTCIACKELGINYIGIDNNKEYCEIARKRLKSVKANLFEKPKPKKKSKKKTKESFGLCE